MRTYSYLVVLAVLLLSFGAVVQADSNATIDFEGLAEGQIVNAVSSGAGISGDAISGSVAVQASRLFFPNPSNAAMIFDGNCNGGCTGDDADLQSNTGNILIVTEDFDGSDPDDVLGGQFVLNFSGFGPGTIDVSSLLVIDTEEAGTVEAFAPGGVSLGSVGLPFLTDGTLATIPLNFSNVEVLVVTFQGSGGLDNLVISVPTPPPPPPPPPSGGEGCTPGFWRIKGGKADRIEALWPVNPDTDYETLFMVDGGNPLPLSLRDAVEANGGGMNALLRHSVAAYLNAASSVNYAFTPDQVKAAVQDAFATGNFEAIKNQLEAENERGCPLNASGR